MDEAKIKKKIEKQTKDDEQINTEKCINSARTSGTIIVFTPPFTQYRTIC